MKAFLQQYGSDLAQLLGAVAFLTVLGVSAFAGLRERQRLTAHRPDVKAPMLAAPVALPPVQRKK